MTHDDAPREFLARRETQIAVAAAGCAAIGVAWGQWLAHPLVGIVAAAVPLAVVISLSAPFELSLAFIVLSYFRIPEVFPILYPLRIPQMVALATLAVLGWHAFGTRRIRPFWSPELSVFALFFAHVALGVLFATNRHIAFDFWSGYYVKVGIVTLAVAWLATGSRQFALASQSFVVAGLTVGAVALWNQAHGIDLVEGTRVTIGREIGSVLGDPNDLALVLLFPASFALGLASTRGVPWRSKCLGSMVLPVLVLALLATQSRGGMLGLAAVPLVFVRRRLKSKLMIVGLAALSVVALFAIAGVGEREIVASGGDDLDESAMGRVWAWRAAFNMALANPLTGIGIDNFRGMFFYYTPHWTGRDTAAHSTWFEVLGETGFPGLFLYITMIGLTARRLLRACRRLEDINAEPFARAMAISLVAGLLGFAVAGSFLSQAFAWPVYIILALSVAVSRYAANLDGPATEGAASRLHVR
jgi:putative inorganic carbon (hco3(-)) transporter